MLIVIEFELIEPVFVEILAVLVLILPIWSLNEASAADLLAVISSSAEVTLFPKLVIVVLLLEALFSRVVVRVSKELTLTSVVPILVRRLVTTLELSVIAVANSPKVSNIAGAPSTKADTFPST